MRVPTDVRPDTYHQLDGCPCGHRHQLAPPVLKGPAVRRVSNVAYVITNDRLYQQVGMAAIDGLPPGQMIYVTGRTVGTVGR